MKYFHFWWIKFKKSFPNPTHRDLKMFAQSLTSPPWWRGRSPHGRSPPRPRDLSGARAAGLRAWCRPAGAGPGPGHTGAAAGGGGEIFVLEKVDYLLVRNRQGWQVEWGRTVILFRLWPDSSFTRTGCCRDLTASAAEMDPTTERWRCETVGLVRPQWSEYREVYTGGTGWDIQHTAQPV